MASFQSQISSQSRGSTATSYAVKTSRSLQNCSHNRETILLVSRTSKNNDRPFYRCPFWQDSTTDCGYFKWADDKPKISDGLWMTNDEVLDLESTQLFPYC
ncbi:hypothetical protein LINPERHAP1_LOCUS34725 [Linum perenne]